MPNAKISLPPGPIIKHPVDLQGQSVALANQTIAWLSANSLRIIIALAFGAAIVVTLTGVKTLAQRLCRDDQAAVDWRTIIGRIAARTSFLFIVIVAARLVDGYADTPPLLDKTIAFFFTIGLTFQAALWLRELVLGFVEHRAGVTDQDHSALGSALSIIRFLVTFTLFSLALVLVLGNLGVNVTGLVAGLGVGGIAIGLAAQGIFKDLFAALAIIFDRPFRKGDSVKWNNISGSVERIGLKTTHIRALTGELVVIGNDDLLKKEIYNLARLDHRRIVLTFSVAYDTSDDSAAEILETLAGIVEQTDKCKLVRVGLSGLDGAGILFELQFDVQSTNYNEVIAARTQVNLAALRQLRQAGVAFAAPDGKALPMSEPRASAALPSTRPDRRVNAEAAHETAP